MQKSNRSDNTMKYKLLYTGLILFVYLLGRGIPLYGIDTAAYANESVNAETLLMQTISGDLYRFSVFALGISPYMLSSLFVQIFVSLKKADAKAKISPKKINHLSLFLTFVLATVQAFMRTESLKFAEAGNLLILTKAVVVLEMVTGVMVILWLSGRNKKYGIGGQTTLIFVNILDGIRVSASRHTPGELVIPLLLSAVMMFVMILMENTEKRIPVQRISIHNIYADKNYLAIKMNPIGVMPVMFSTACFMLPQFIVLLLALLFPEHSGILWWQQNMVLSRPLGAVVYILVLYALTIVFSMVFIGPGDLTEQFLKCGDSILNLHAGRDTKRYLSREVFRISFFSATVMGICLGAPLALQMRGGIDSTLVMLPSSFMMLSGIFCNLYQEFIVIRNFDAYRPFI